LNPQLRLPGALAQGYALFEDRLALLHLGGDDLREFRRFQLFGEQ
jgi:hypothetical protein